MKIKTQKPRWTKWNNNWYELDVMLPKAHDLGIHCDVRRNVDSVIGDMGWRIALVVFGEREFSSAKTYTTAQEAMKNAEIELGKMVFDHINDAHQWVANITKDKSCQRKAAKTSSKKKSKSKRKSKN